jgi:hypothetical protein
VVFFDDRTIVIISAAKVYAQQDRIGKTHMFVTNSF